MGNLSASASCVDVRPLGGARIQVQHVVAVQATAREVRSAGSPGVLVGQASPCGTPGAALWLPATGSTAPPDGCAGQVAEATGPFLDRFLAFDEALARHHLVGALHHDLAILAVRPDSQGQGIASALLRDHHATFDWQGIAAYLEASCERTRELYLRHGYTDHGEPIELPDGPSMYPMIRIPGLRPQRGPAAS